jgi:hypothetical protein
VQAALDRDGAPEPEVDAEPVRVAVVDVEDLGPVDVGGLHYGASTVKSCV